MDNYRYVNNLKEEAARADCQPCIRDHTMTVKNIIFDNIEKPIHYNSYPSIEVIQLTEHMNFCRGNVVKYLARAAFKGNELEDLKKALWYLTREIKRLEGESGEKQEQ